MTGSRKSDRVTDADAALIETLVTIYDDLHQIREYLDSERAPSRAARHLTATLASLERAIVASGLFQCIFCGGVIVGTRF